VKRRKEYFPFNSDKLINTTLPNLKVLITPPLISINWLPESKLYRSILKVNERIIIHRVKQIIKRFKINSYIFINSFNFYYPDLGRLLSPKLAVYHCVDPIVFSCDRKHGLVSEQQIVKESEMVICTSKKLFDEKAKFNKNTFFVPNAADITHSNKALQPELPVHDCLSGIKRPIVGYFGTVERRLDYALIDQLTRVHKEISFVFTGPISSELVPQWFYERPNIHLTGPVPYEQMPQVLKGFDVAIIPFKKDEFSENIFPLKLFEYLGSGKPVVATNFNTDLKDFTLSTVAYCNDAASFAEAILIGLYNDTEEQKQARLAIAGQNTWERRGDEFSELISDHMSGINQEKHQMETYTLDKQA
jgi:glycosyltransferase involved in cell wall biosynthesis